MHHTQAIMTGRYFLGLEAPAIISDKQINNAGSILKVDLYLVSPGMFGDVVEYFLADAVEGHLHVGRQVSSPHHGNHDGDVRPASEGVAQLAQQVAQFAVNQDFRPQLGQKRTHLSQRATRQTAQVFQRLPTFIRVFFPQAR